MVAKQGTRQEYECGPRIDFGKSLLRGNAKLVSRSLANPEFLKGPNVAFSLDTRTGTVTQNCQYQLAAFLKIKTGWRYLRVYKFDTIAVQSVGRLREEY